MLKTQFLSLLAAPILTGFSSLHAGIFKAETVPAEAQWYLHGDLEGLRDTTTGKLLIKGIKEKHKKDLDGAKELFGFDIMTDLTDVTLFGDGKDERAAILLQGEINRAHLEGMIVNADDYDTSLHEGTVIHQWEDKGKNLYAGFHGQNLIVMGEQKDLVTLSLDTLAKRKPAIKVSPDFSIENPIVAAVANVKKIDLPKDDGSKLIRNADSIIVSISEKGDNLCAELIADTKSAETAEQLKAAADGLIAMGMLSDEKIQQLQIKHESKVEGTQMQINLSLSIAKALALLAEMD